MEAELLGGRHFPFLKTNRAPLDTSIGVTHQHFKIECLHYPPERSFIQYPCK